MSMCNMFVDVILLITIYYNLINKLNCKYKMLISNTNKKDLNRNYFLNKNFTKKCILEQFTVLKSLNLYDFCI